MNRCRQCGRPLGKNEGEFCCRTCEEKFDKAHPGQLQAEAGEGISWLSFLFCFAFGFLLTFFHLKLGIVIILAIIGALYHNKFIFKVRLITLILVIIGCVLAMHFMW